MEEAVEDILPSLPGLYRCDSKSPALKRWAIISRILRISYRTGLKRRVETQPEIRGAAILVITDLGAMEIEITVGDVSALER